MTHAGETGAPSPSNESVREATWEPTEANIEAARVTDFIRWLGERRGVALSGYRDLWRWSVSEPSLFWEAVAAYFDLIGSGWESQGLADERMPGAVWFPDARLNFAENVLRPSSDPVRRDDVAILDLAEDDAERRLTWADLAGQVGAFAEWLRGRGVGRGDRVAAVLPNRPEAIVGLLAAASIGAVWTISSPELAPEATLGRLRQLEPRVLIAVERYRYGGKDFDVANRVAMIEAELTGLEHTVIVGEEPTSPTRERFSDIVKTPSAPRFDRVEFAHPLWVLFSSGTTGAPKGIVHGHGGILLESVKGPGLNQDMGYGDRYYVAANTSWMVWNTLVTNMAAGASVVTYAGSPTLGGPGRQFDILARTGATMFATGAAYLQLAERSGIVPRDAVDLWSLRSILSTGSPLPVSTWRWVHREVKPSVHLGSDTGGTDICSGFIGSNPLEPVHAGLLQGPLLGVAVEAWDESGARVLDSVGELVVARPMPSMPVALWNDDSGERYRAAYFERFPGVWTQGDWITETALGEFVVHGRSDATLNRQGVRIGPADIYAAVAAVDEVTDAVVIGVELPDGDYYMPLFVVLGDGATLDEELTARIGGEIRSRASARHVPDEIIQAPAVPVTHAGKKLEVPLKRLFAGRTVEDAVNLDSVANPESVAWYAKRAAAFRAARGLSY